MTRPLPRSVRATFETLAPLVAAIPRAWAIDRVFRLAVLAAGLAFATLVARPWLARPEPAEDHLDVPSPPTSLPALRARYQDPDLLQDSGAMPVPSGPLAPGRSLDGLRLDPDPAAAVDPFGTDLQPGKSPLMPRPSISIPSSIPALALIMSLCGGLVGPAVAQQTAGPDRAADALSQAQFDRIEAKLDALLQRFGTGPDAGVAGPSEETGSVSSSPRSSPGGAPAAGVEAIGVATGSFDGSAAAAEPPSLPTDTDSYRSGALAVAHAAPIRGQPLSETPADSIGGSLYTGGPIRLTHLSDRSVRYAGPAGIELQSWLRATETGRYQIAADLQLRFGKGAISALPCTLSAWLENQSIGSKIRSVEPWGTKGEPVALSVVLGAELQPGLYKVRFSIACADLSVARGGESLQVELLLKSPAEMNVHPVTAEDLQHR